MSISTQLSALLEDRTAIRSALLNQGISAASTHGFDDFASDIRAIRAAVGLTVKQGETELTSTVSGYTFAHYLNVLPHLAIFYTTDPTAWANTSGAPVLLATVRFANASGMVSAGYKTFSIWRNADGTLSGEANPNCGILTDPTTTQMTVTGPSGAPLRAGIPYKWFVARFDT